MDGTERNRKKSPVDIVLIFFLNFILYIFIVTLLSSVNYMQRLRINI